ncbi:MAG: hypothetical protein HYW34_03865 [Candidatus Brennerbacteria bacterium]|nr:hypothetical protein [Candidatus Brennerbacteria bacterium]
MLFNFKAQDGIAGILIIVSIALFVFAISIYLAVQSNTSIFAGQFETQADKAQFLAESGIQDGILKIARNKNYTGSYTITETDGTIDINVAGGTPVIISATSTVSKAFSVVKRAMRADVTIDNDGKITAITKTNQ